MLGTITTAITAAPFAICAWDYFKPGQEPITKLVSKGIASLVSRGISKTAWGSTAISPDFINSAISQAENWGRKDLKNAAKLHNHYLLAPIEYANTVLTITARKLYFHISGEAIGQTLSETTAKSVGTLAKKLRMSKNTTFLRTFEESVVKIFHEKSKAEDAPSLSKARLTALSTQLFLETALPWLVRWYAVSTATQLITFNTSYVYPIATVGCLWAYISRLIPSTRKELCHLEPPVQPKTINLLDSETIDAILNEAKDLFDLSDEDKEAKKKLRELKGALEILDGTPASNHPFPSLKSSAPSMKAKEAQPEATGKGWVNTLTSFVFASKDSKEEKKTVLRARFTKLEAKKNALADGTPEKAKAVAEMQAVRREYTELAGNGEAFCRAWKEQMSAQVEALKLENGDVKLYIQKQLKEIDSKKTDAIRAENFDLAKQLVLVKEHAKKLHKEAEKKADLTPQASPVKKHKDPTPQVSPRKKLARTPAGKAPAPATPQTIVKKAVEKAAEAISSDEESGAGVSSTIANPIPPKMQSLEDVELSSSEEEKVSEQEELSAAEDA